MFTLYSMFDGWFYTIILHDPAFIHSPIILTMVLKDYYVVYMRFMEYLINLYCDDITLYYIILYCHTYYCHIASLSHNPF